MKYVYGSILFALGITVGVSARYGAGTPVFAQTKPMPLVTVSLWETADTLGSIAEAFGFDEVVFTSEDAKELALGLSADEQLVLAGSETALSQLNEAAQHLANILEAELGDAGIAGDDATKSAGLPSAPYSGICGPDRMSTGALVAALEVFLAAEIVREEALRGCQQTGVAAGVGGNTSTACLVTDAVFFVAKAVYENIVLCEGDIDSAEIKGTYDRAAHIHADIGGLDEKLDHIIELILKNAEAIEKNRVAICDNSRVVTTPQGRRFSDCATCSDQPGFPYDWPEGQGPQNTATASTPTSGGSSSGGWLSRLFSRWF
jgi:hypothetical protein